MTQNPKSVTNGCKPNRKPPAENEEFLAESRSSVDGSVKNPKGSTLSYGPDGDSVQRQQVNHSGNCGNYMYHQV